MRSAATAGARGFSAQARPVVSSNVFDGFLKAVGNTPLIKLHGPSEATGCNIYGKAEFANPGGSVKDRAAVQMILEAEEQGVLVKGQPGVIVEGTAGNTGIGLALAGNARGYRTVICIANTQSKEKIEALQFAGADVLQVPAVPYKNPNNYVHVAQRLAAKLSQERGGTGVLYANQWDNLANRRAHIHSTGPEIWAQTGGKLHAFNCAMGTGGTLSGVTEFLKTKNKNIKSALTDPCGGALYRLFTEGELKSQGSSITEGIGQGRVTGNMVGLKPDLAYEISDEEALPVLYDLLRKDGFALGGSSGINVAGAMRVAKELGPGHTVVTILCDLGSRYASRIYNPEFLRSRGLMVPPWLDGKPDLLKQTLLEMLPSCMVEEPVAK
eukprot:gb/GEZN01010725.1/.p1 GENE.gb/GEZN01010725.1/~~gb/GEZN01010725.1/.p1  ORF type:complete len:383 (-),score=42.31 gb/GEZN01010725.1/:36-1184(-)